MRAANGMATLGIKNTGMFLIKKIPVALNEKVL